MENCSSRIEKVIAEIRKLAEGIGSNIEIKYLDNKKCVGYVNIQFLDSIENKSLYGGMCQESCVKSLLYDEKMGELHNVLKKGKCGHIEVNRYKEGTQIGFYMKDEGYQYEDNIEISTPGVHAEVVTKGELYYVGFTKYKVEDTSFSKRELLNIEFLKGNGGFELYFEGIEDPIIIITRGHVADWNKILNRFDHGVMATDLNVFCEKMLEQIKNEKMINKTEEIKNLEMIMKDKLLELNR